MKLNKSFLRISIASALLLIGLSFALGFKFGFAAGIICGVCAFLLLIAVLLILNKTSQK